MMPWSLLLGVGGGGGRRTSFYRHRCCSAALTLLVFVGVLQFCCQPAVAETTSTSDVIDGGDDGGDHGGSGDGGFQLNILAGDQDSLEDLFGVCAHPPGDGVVTNDVDKDGICGGREIVTFGTGWSAEDADAGGDSSVFVSVYKTSGGGDHGLAVSLLGACYAHAAPGTPQVVTIVFVVSADRVLHLSTLGGLTGENCRTDIPLDDPALFQECEAPVATCEQEAEKQAAEMESAARLLEDENALLLAKQAQTVAERDELATQLHEAAEAATAKAAKDASDDDERRQQQEALETQLSEARQQQAALQQRLDALKGVDVERDSLSLQLQLAFDTAAERERHQERLQAQLAELQHTHTALRDEHHLALASAEEERDALSEQLRSADAGAAAQQLSLIHI